MHNLIKITFVPDNDEASPQYIITNQLANQLTMVKYAQDNSQGELVLYIDEPLYTGEDDVGFAREDVGTALIHTLSIARMNQYSLIIES